MGRAGRSRAGRTVTSAAGSVREIALRDGARVRIRQSGAADAARVAALYERVSPDPMFQQFAAVITPLVDWARLAADDAMGGRWTLLAEDTGASPSDVVAVASCERTPTAEMAQVALLVRHDWQDRGLGTALLDALLEGAEARGMRRFTAAVLASNHRMLDMLERCGAVESRSGGSGVTEIVFTRRLVPPALGAARVPARAPATTA
jgi:GNAT superfamily N-acetyltransferase